MAKRNLRLCNYYDFICQDKQQVAPKLEDNYTVAEEEAATGWRNKLSDNPYLIQF